MKKLKMISEVRDFIGFFGYFLERFFLIDEIRLLNSAFLTELFKRLPNFRREDVENLVERVIEMDKFLKKKFEILCIKMKS